MTRCQRRVHDPAQAYGVTNFPDPTSTGFTSGPGSGINPQSPAFTAADAGAEG